MFSDDANINFGVLQGSILGPTFFLIYIKPHIPITCVKFTLLQVKSSLLRIMIMMMGRSTYTTETRLARIAKWTFDS